MMERERKRVRGGCDVDSDIDRRGEGRDRTILGIY